MCEWSSPMHAQTPVPDKSEEVGKTYIKAGQGDCSRAHAGPCLRVQVIIGLIKIPKPCEQNATVQAHTKGGATLC